MDKLIDIPALKPQGKSNEWYTPARYFEAARRAMGGIDLDPASCELANRTVKAARYYTAQNSGLACSWYGRIWLNPPFGKVNNKSGIRIFTEKLIEEYKLGHIEQAVFLGTSDCDASWFHPLWDFLICFPDHNVYFNRPVSEDRTEKEARHGHWFGTVFVYLGPNERAFINEFSQFGTIAKRVNQPKPKPVMVDLWQSVAS